MKCEGVYMVQSVNNQSVNQFGAINRVGNTPDGRVVYSVTDGNGREAGKMSVAAKDCDMFEKSYRDVIDSAPKIQKYVQTHSSPEDVKRRKRISIWITGICAAIGAGVPIHLTRKASTIKQVLATVAGLVVGVTSGFALSFSATTPPGTMKFSKATKNMSKIDIQPYYDV